MTFIHQAPDWPKLSWDAEAISAELARVRHKQGRHLGKMEALGFDLRTETNLEALTREAVSSSAIEGEKLSPEEVRSSLSRKLGLDIAGLPEPSRHVDGVVEIMIDATRNFEAPLTDERLFGWHSALFPTGRSGVKRIVVGGWRTGAGGPMQVVSGIIGRERVHFEAPDATRVEEEMAEFLNWFNGTEPVDPVLKAAVAHFWFVTIHPFEDGNGRIARAVADMALARADGIPERFYSMSTAIGAKLSDYYEQLESVQRGNLNITRWILWFLRCLDEALDDAASMVAPALHEARARQKIGSRRDNERQTKVIHRLLESFEGNLTTSKYAKLAKCSSDTALRDIQELVESGVFVKNPGGGRSTSYRLVGEGGT